MKNYQDFKLSVNEALNILSQRGKKGTPKKWSKESPYQKARYKPEYVFPEVWIAPDCGGLNILVNGGDYKSIPEIIAFLSSVL